MPTYEVTQDATGITLELTGDKPPGLEDLNAAFAAYGKAQSPQAGAISGRTPSIAERAVEGIREGTGLDLQGALDLVRSATRPGITTAPLAPIYERTLGYTTVPPEKPLGSAVEREGVAALFGAGERKREQGRQIGEEVGGIVGPKTAAAGGVIGQAAADLLSPMNLMTMGVLGAARGAAQLPSALRAAGEAATMAEMSGADLTAAANAAKIVRPLETGVAAAFAPGIAAGASDAVAQANQVLGSPEATTEDKIRATLQAGISTLFAAGIGGALAAGIKGRAPTQGQVMDALANRKLTIEEGLEGLRGLRQELAAVEATLPKDRTTPISEQQATFEANLANAGNLVDQALVEAQQAVKAPGQTALEALKAGEREVVAPEKIGEGPREFVQLGERTLPEAPVEGGPLRSAEDIIAQRVEPNIPPFVEEPPAPEAKPLRSLEDIMQEQAQRRQASQIAAMLESGAVQPPPAEMSRAVIDQMLGVSRKPTGQAAGESLIIREAAEVGKEMALKQGARQPKEAPAPAAKIAEAIKTEAVQTRKPPEQMTPEEAKGKKIPQWVVIVSKKGGGPMDTGHTHTYLMVAGEAEARAYIQNLQGKELSGSYRATGKSYNLEDIHRNLIESKIAEQKPVSSSSVDAYGIKLPEGWTRQGDLYAPPKEAPGAGGEGAVTVENPFDTRATSRRLTELRDSKPRPTEKLFGKSGGTPEQREANDSKLRKWNNEYRKAQKAHADMVEKSNEWLRQQKSAPVAEPAAAPETGRFRQKAEGVASELEKLRTKVEPGLGANPIPQLLGSTWNGAITVAQDLLKLGASIADAIEGALKYARLNYKGKFDEALFRDAANAYFAGPAIIPPEPGMKPRRFAERVAASPDVPPVIRQGVAQSREAKYKPQNVEMEASAASTASNADLQADVASETSNTRTISGLELANRMIASGDMQGAQAMFLSLAKKGTQMGQLINQYKLLKSATPEGLVALISTERGKQGKPPLTEVEVGEVKKVGTEWQMDRDAVDAALDRRARAANENDQTAFDEADQQVIDAQGRRKATEVRLAEVLGRVSPASMQDMVLAMVQGSVLAPISVVRNVLGNVINVPMREAAGLASTIGGKTTFNLRDRTIGRIATLARSLPEAGRIVLKGADAMPYEAGNGYANPLNFQRGWARLFDAMTGEAPPSTIPRSAVEATLGMVPDAFLRLVAATDLPFRQAERARVISEIGRKAGLNELQLKAAMDSPERFRVTPEQRADGRKGFTDEDLAWIDLESARAVYQQENVGTQAFATANRFLQQKTPSLYVPFRLMSLFQKTPVNVLAEVLSFTPLGFLDARRSKGREFDLAISKAIIGTIALGALGSLTKIGIIEPNLESPGETNKGRELARNGGVQPPGTMNVSALQRALKGGSPKFKAGDTVWNLESMGVVGALATMVGAASRARERARVDAFSPVDAGFNMALGTVNFIMQQQFLKGQADFMNMLGQQSGGMMERFAKSMLTTAASPIAPNVLASIRRAEREFVPVTGGEGVLKGVANELNQRWSALPGVKPNELPLRRDLWGEPIKQTPKGENPWTFQLLDALKSRTIDDDPINGSIYRLWRRTADNRAIPSIPLPKITFNGVTYERLTPALFEDYAEAVGKARRLFTERTVMSGAYQRGDDDVRVRMLNRAYDRGQRSGLYVFLRQHKNELVPLSGKLGATSVYEEAEK